MNSLKYETAKFNEIQMPNTHCCQASHEHDTHYQSPKNTSLTTWRIKREDNTMDTKTRHPTKHPFSPLTLIL